MKDLKCTAALCVFEVKVSKEVLLEHLKTYEILLEDMNEFYCKVSSWRLKYHTSFSTFAFAGELST